MTDQVEFYHLVWVAKNNSIDVEIISAGKVQQLSHWDEGNSSYSEFLSLAIGRTKSLGYFTGFVLSIIFCLEFIFGVVGNVSVCIIMMKRRFLHTDINAYHASLAVADVLRVLIALPPEVYAIWEAYPWRFGEPFCIFKSFLLESTSYASVLTITGFTIERYIAICHPITGQKVSRQSRAMKCILCIWIVSALSALPYPIHTRTFYFMQDPRTSSPIPDSLLCNIPIQWHPRMKVMFQVSTFAFFFLPMTVITVMYILIGIRLRRTEIDSSIRYFSKGAKSTATRARKAVLRMLVAVVVAFFVCWAPFHAQRLTSLYIKTWTPEEIEIHSKLFYVSGVLYFLSSTVNPILYNVLSRKFRYAFKRTFCRCCLNLEAFPTFYKLKAIFINKNEQQSTTPSGMRYLFPQKPIVLDTFYQKHNRRLSKTEHPLNQGSTKDTLLKVSTGCGSSSGTHAHSDGRLHCLCRHKSCSSHRTRQSIESQMFCKQFSNASYQDIETLKRLQCFRDECHLKSFDSVPEVMERDVNVNLI